MRLHLDPPSARASEAGQTRAATPSSSTAQGFPANSTGGVDTIRISSASAALSQLSAERTARVQQLSAAVQSGSYQVAPAAISSAIVEQALG